MPGKIVFGLASEVNVSIDDNTSGWVRMSVVSESDDKVTMLIPKQVAHDAALEMSPDVVERGEND